MEYVYSGTIMASVEMSALLFFPYTLEWVECDSWAFNNLHEFYILFSHKMGYMACSQSGQGVGSFIRYHRISGVFKIMRNWIHQVHSGSVLCTHKEQRTSLCPTFNNQSFWVWNSWTSMWFKNLSFVSSQKKIFTDVSEQIIFLADKYFYFFFISLIWLIWLIQRTTLQIVA